MDHRTELRRDGGDQPNKSLVLSTGFRHEELQYSNHFSTSDHWERNAGMQAGGSSGLRALEIGLVGNVLDPRWLAQRPDAAGQAFAGMKVSRPGVAKEIFQALG